MPRSSMSRPILKDIQNLIKLIKEVYELEMPLNEYDRHLREITKILRKYPPKKWVAIVAEYEKEKPSYTIIGDEIKVGILGAIASTIIDGLTYDRQKITLKYAPKVSMEFLSELSNETYTYDSIYEAIGAKFSPIDKVILELKGMNEQTLTKKLRISIPHFVMNNTLYDD